MRRLVERVLNAVVRRGVRRGVLEGSILWLVLGAVAFLVRLLARPESPKIVTQKLRLGESIVVTHREPERKTRGQRRPEAPDPRPEGRRSTSQPGSPEAPPAG